MVGSHINSNQANIRYQILYKCIYYSGVQFHVPVDHLALSKSCNNIIEQMQARRQQQLSASDV